MAEIAASCEVSTATVFNHFGTKRELLASWAAAEIDAELAELFDGEAEAPLRRRLRASARRLADRVAERRALHELAWQVRAPWAPARLETPGLRGLETALEEARQRDELRADWGAGDLARLLVLAIESAIGETLAHGESGERVGREIRARLDLVLDGARKRNERVRSSAPAPAGPGT